MYIKRRYVDYRSAPCRISGEDLVSERDKYGANDVTPGLTGLAQINGRDVLASDIEKKAWYDGEYAKKITFWGDLKIFFKTIAKVFKEDGIVEGDSVVTKEETKVEQEVATTKIDEEEK